MQTVVWMGSEVILSLYMNIHTQKHNISYSITLNIFFFSSKNDWKGKLDLAFKTDKVTLKKSDNASLSDNKQMHSLAERHVFEASLSLLHTLGSLMVKTGVLRAMLLEWVVVLLHCAHSKQQSADTHDYESCSVWSHGLTSLLYLRRSSCKCSTRVSVENMPASPVRGGERIQ